MLLPETAHACFHKAAHYLGVDVIPVAVDPVTFRATCRRRPREDDRRRHPRRRLGAELRPRRHRSDHRPRRPRIRARRADARGRVRRRLRAPVPARRRRRRPALRFRRPRRDEHLARSPQVRLRAEGRVDPLQRRRELRDAQYYACARWTGYSIVNSTTLGSKSLAAMGAAFALIHHLGREATASAPDSCGARPRSSSRRSTRCPSSGCSAARDEPLRVHDHRAGGCHTGRRLRALRPPGRARLARPAHVPFGSSPAHIHLTLDPGNSARVAELAADLKAALVDLPPRQDPPGAVVAMLEMIATGGGAGSTPATSWASSGSRMASSPSARR
jgi:sphinganine-1-phosphate aldolase